MRPGETAGSDAASDSETTSGVITYQPGDTPSVITIDGITITTVGQVITNANGSLTITSLASGAIGYSFTLADNTLGDATSTQFVITITDAMATARRHRW